MLYWPPCLVAVVINIVVRVDARRAAVRRGAAAARARSGDVVDVVPSAADSKGEGLWCHGIAMALSGERNGTAMQPDIGNHMTGASLW